MIASQLKMGKQEQVGVNFCISDKCNFKACLEFLVSILVFTCTLLLMVILFQYNFLGENPIIYEKYLKYLISPLGGEFFLCVCVSWKCLRGKMEL